MMTSPGLIPARSAGPFGVTEPAASGILAPVPLKAMSRETPIIG